MDWGGEGQLGLHRLIRITVGPEEGRALLHDDFHHFRVRVRHDGATVLGISAEMLRGPYSLCPRAGEELRHLVGGAVTAGMGEVVARVAARRQCTHQLELAALAIAAIGRGRDCAYDAGVRVVGPDRFDADAVCSSRISLAWQVSGDHINAPGRFAGIGIGAGFSMWVTATLPAEEAECALVLRRCVVLARARRHLEKLDARSDAPANGYCWVQQPGTAESARRLRGVVRDYSASDVPLSPADREWLAGVR